MPTVSIVKVPGGYRMNGVFLADPPETPERQAMVHACAEALSEALDAGCVEEVMKRLREEQAKDAPPDA